ncbi:BadF/BadG/BcrA/BcrD ATPase family protein [Lutimaribacter marinistellae]|uniref:BadF/BadG/BcrA/BcrD ATPase family protein n=1 Tax=Lutimaribacter marinistellae TaxID=1820329 RepID=A0ABV7TM05_9RHOB
MSEEALICAVDGGGTGCRAALATLTGKVLSRAEAGPANITTDPGGAVLNIMTAVERAALKLGPHAPKLEHLTAHLGLAGLLGADQGDAVAQRLPFARVTVSDDQKTALHGALGPRNGALLAAGTGSFVARRWKEITFFIGGWGLQLGDQGSGAWMGRELLGHILMAEDGLRRHSSLTNTVLARFEGETRRIVDFARDASPGDYAVFAPEVVAAADARDAAATTLMEKGAAYFDEALAMMDLHPDEVVCLSGGLGPHYERFLSPTFRSRIAPPAGDALDGALYLAQHLAEDSA